MKLVGSASLSISEESVSMCFSSKISGIRF
jgi:hypothetical protein